MNKTELISAVAQTAEMTKKDSEKAVKAVIDVISQALVKGDKVQLIGFGTFEVRQRKAREGHNPRSGKKLELKGIRLQLLACWKVKVTHS